MGKGKLSPMGVFNGEPRYSWKFYDTKNLAEVYTEGGFDNSYTSRTKFKFHGSMFYLVENKGDILLTDNGLIPLVKLPIEMPGDLNGTTGFSAPRVKEVGKNTYFVSFQQKTEGDREGDWNEPETYDSANTHYYVAEI